MSKRQVRNVAVIICDSVNLNRFLKSKEQLETSHGKLTSGTHNTWKSLTSCFITPAMKEITLQWVRHTPLGFPTDGNKFTGHMGRYTKLHWGCGGGHSVITTRVG